IFTSCFIKVVWSIFEAATLARAIFPTATPPYAIGIYSKIFRYFFGRAAIATDCLLALKLTAIGKASMGEANRKSECKYALMHLRLSRTTRMDESGRRRG